MLHTPLAASSNFTRRLDPCLVHIFSSWDPGRCSSFTLPVVKDSFSAASLCCPTRGCCSKPFFVLFRLADSSHRRLCLLFLGRTRARADDGRFTDDGQVFDAGGHVFCEREASVTSFARAIRQKLLSPSTPAAPGSAHGSSDPKAVSIGQARKPTEGSSLGRKANQSMRA